jgi:arabinose-5-phosphate isomerase
MLETLFAEQRRYFDHYFDHLDSEQAKKIFNLFLNCPGMIVFTGVGKSGIVAEKIAMTFISTGTKALYLPPTNFLHGDIGILSSQDLLVLLSKSGETEELLNLIPFARRRQVGLVSFVSNPSSRLAKDCDHTMVLPVEKELCSFDLVPTTSAAAQLVFGDALAIALMKAKNFTLADYAQNHPSGSIGKKMTLTVEDLMFKGEHIPLCRPEDRVCDLLVELSNKKCGCLLVADEKKHLQGIFTDGDLRRSLQTHGPAILQKPIGELMTISALSTSKESLAYDALKMMQKDPKRWIMMLPVLEDQKKVVGIVRMHDIINSGLS